MWDKTSVAGQLYETYFAQQSAEIRAEQAIAKMLGCPDHDEPDGIWPWEAFTYDWYDESFELVDAEESIAFTPEHMAQLAALGFQRCWIRYKDLTEVFYGLESGRVGERRPGHGETYRDKPGRCQACNERHIERAAP